jgi:CubicO group peptidase (beta-lactamase class C family)
MLMGIAVDRGLLDRRAPVSKYLGPGWSHAGVDAERAITVNHLLTMTSGLNDALEFASPAGSVWHYNTPAYSQLIGVLAAVTRKDVNDYSAEWLTSAIGMTDTRWIKRQSAFPNPYGLATTARDMARMGLLVLRNGAWAGKQIVSEAYVREAIRSSQTLNPSYGLLWWTNRHVPGSSEPTLATNVFAVPAAPSDLVAGLGAADRKVYVVPSRQLVIVRLGAAVSGPGRRFDREVWERLASAIH